MTMPSQPGPSSTRRAGVDQLLGLANDFETSSFVSIYGSLATASI
jgi:hypothetical protein